jgi:hypothetical protein
MHGIRVEKVRGQAENSIRVNGTPQSRISNVCFDQVCVTFGRWTRYKGGLYDNRPTKVLSPIEDHPTDGINLRYVDGAKLKNCDIEWQANCPDYFRDSVSMEQATGLQISGLKGDLDKHPVKPE